MKIYRKTPDPKLNKEKKKNQWKGIRKILIGEPGILELLAWIAAIVAAKPIIFPPKQPDLISKETFVNYNKLRKQIDKGNWEKADQELNQIFQDINITKKTKYFPCRDLEIIDNLWFSRSGGVYGLRVQTTIHNKFKDNYPWRKRYKDYFEEVNWIKNGEVINVNDIDYKNKKNVYGYLPAKIVVNDVVDHEKLYEQFRICVNKGEIGIR